MMHELIELWQDKVIRVTVLLIVLVGAFLWWRSGFLSMVAAFCGGLIGAAIMHVIVRTFGREDLP
jgi:uncharacterized membrane protein YdjX (TVP38/TMEM64 family)